jgi:hypothetical protein
MSEHTWSMEQIATYIAGGLDDAERERLEAHACACVECTAALERSRELDRRLGALFEGVCPGVDLEDRTLRALRLGRQNQPVREGWQKRLLIAAGVMFIVTSVGFVGSRAEQFPTPWNVHGWSLDKLVGIHSEKLRAEETASAEMEHDNYQEQKGDRERALWREARERQQNLTNSDFGLNPQFQATLNQRLPGLGLIDRQNLNSIARTDKESKPNASSGDLFAAQSQVKLKEGTWFEASVNGNVFGRANSNIDSYYPFATSFVPGNFKPDAGRTEQKSAVKAPPAHSPYLSLTQPPVDEKERSFREDLNDAERKGPLPSSSKGGRNEVEPTATQPIPEPKAEPAPRNVVIRSGEIEFEVDSFDSAAATVSKLVLAIKGAFIATVNSDKLTNGKVKGAITVRLPPEQLDGLLLDLRKELSKGGDLRGVRVGSQDITKQYTDLESRLKAARTMEQRLLQMIKEGKGEIKQLLDAEKELGVWRTKIEETEGELRYYANLVALSTLTITLTEKEIRAAATMTESERIQAGVEVEDVDRAYQLILTAVTEAKGRVTKSDLKQLSAGQFNATLNFEVAPEAAGTLRDRLRQLGRVARLEIDRLQQPEGVVIKNAKVQRGDTLFFVQLYNLANIAPRKSAIVQVAVTDVPAAYRALQESVAKASGRVLVSQLNEQDRQNVTAQLDFEVQRTEEETLRNLVETLGEVVARQVTRAPESDNVTDSKVYYKTSLVAADHLKPRERVSVALEVGDVEQAVVLLGAQVGEAKGRPVDDQFTRDRSGRLTAKIVYVVPLSRASGLVERFKAAGAVHTYQSTRDPEAAEGKYATARLEVTLTTSERIVGVDEGLWPQVRQGLSYSAAVLLTSITWLVFGLCVLLPWALIGYGGYRLLRWSWRGKKISSVPASSPGV